MCLEFHPPQLEWRIVENGISGPKMSSEQLIVSFSVNRNVQLLWEIVDNDISGPKMLSEQPIVSFCINKIVLFLD